MALGPRLDLRQSQSLVMTPQLQQAIKLLALSNLEIETFIGEAIEGNPLLELGAESPPDLPSEAGPPPEERRTALESSPIDRLIGEGRGGHADLVAPHPVQIALKRVDLAVVGQHPEGLGQPPFGEGVGRIALVEDGVGRFEARIEQVGV